MAIEVLGARLLAPSVGVTMAVWTALIATTLVFLSIGYAAGGRCSTYQCSELLISAALIGAGLYCLLLPLWSDALNEYLTSWGIRSGALLGATLVVALPCLCLAFIVPLAADLIGLAPGPAAGRIFAVSTSGSVIGTLLAGYVLVPVCGLRAAFTWIGCVLIVLGGLGFTRRQHRRALLIAGIPIIVAGAARLALPERVLGPGQLLFQKEGQYGHVAVLDTDSGRYLLVNQTVQGFRLADRGPLHSFWERGNLLGLVPMIRPQARTCCAIGVGGGVLCEVLADEGLEILGVDIDPVVVDAARRHFDFNHDVVIADGRAFLSRCSVRFDVLFIDAYASENLPFHLFTREAFIAAKRCLQPGGLLVMHVITDADSPAIDAIAATLQTAFREVCVIRLDDQLAPVWIFASNDPLIPPEANLPILAAEILQHRDTSFGDGPILTDNLNPLDLLYARDARAYRMAVARPPRDP